MNSNLAIRAAREDFNIAIAKKDASAILNLLAPTYHLITGRSVQYHGGKEESARWAALFHDDPTAIYQRSPKKSQ